MRINSPYVTVTDQSTLTIGNLLALDSGEFSLANGGEITGGRILVAAGADFQAAGGTLSHVKFEGSLTVASELTIGADTAFSADRGTGPATITTNYGTVAVLGETRIDTVLINLDGTLISQASDGHAGLLVLGSGVTIDQTGNGPGSTGSPVSIISGADAAIINNGTINAEVAGGQLDLDANLLNNGAINLGNADTIDLVGTSTGGHVAKLIDSINDSGGTIALGGTITGGTMDASVSGYDGTLSGVRFEGTLTLAAPDYDVGSSYGISVTDGTQFLGAGGAGSATVDISNNAALTFAGSDTINHVVFNLSGLYYGGVINTAGTSSAATTLTLGRQTVINAISGENILTPVQSAAAAQDMIVNEGTINIAANAGLDLSVANFVNDGTINLGAGADILLKGTSQSNDAFSGAEAQTLIESVHNSGGDFTFEGDIVGGTLDGTFYQFVSGTLTGVALQGTLNLNYATIDFDEGTSFAGAGGVGRETINAASGILGSSGSATLDNVNVSIGATSQFGARLNVIDSASGAGTFTIGAAATITQNGTYVALTSGFALGSGFVNDGVIDASFAGGTLFVEANEFVNAATIDVSNGEALRFENSGSTLQSIGHYSNTGSIQLESSTSLSLVSASFTNGVAGSITLDTSASGTTTLAADRNSAFENDGTLSASGAGFVSLSGDITNAGLITSGSGTLQFMSGLTNNGTVADSGGLLVLSGAVGGTGVVNIGAGGDVSMLGGASVGQTVDFLSSGGDLTLKSPASFLGTIAGFGGSDVITLTKTAETGYGFANGVLTVTDGSSTVASLTFAGTYSTQDFSVATNAHGNTVITFS